MENQAGARKGVTATPAKNVPPVGLLRIHRNIAEFSADPLLGIFNAPEENDITNINAIRMDPKNTVLEGGFFHCYVQCIDLYPLELPKVSSMTTDAARAEFNEYIYERVSTCLISLNTFTLTWTPAMSLSSLFHSIQWLLSDVQKMKDKTLSDCFELILQHDTIKVAVCDTVEACLQDNPQFAKTVRDVVLEKFAELYDMYEVVVRSMLHPTGNQINEPAEFNSDIYQFEKLLTRLQDLKQIVAEKKEVPMVKAGS
ncbi:ubiquitin-conjugating enzyme E2 Z-like [Rhipicephalus microplus]|uniref:ubiquitin-conjugating enzyme E2 Z-like n=1 Tax=Rhipicephalus microplus TaxID=6941 RepID=UPI003F6A871A